MKPPLPSDNPYHPRPILLQPPSWMETIDRPRFQTSDSGSDRDKMLWVIEISRLNVIHQSGGPFAAAVFDISSGQLVSIGVNRVIDDCSSVSHAEILALASAQQFLGTQDLGNRPSSKYELISSAQPCIMCFGALLWSGVARLVYGAPKRRVEEILGFDEGPLPSRWKKELGRRSIEVRGPICSRQASRVLNLYREKEGTIYNPTRQSTQKSLFKNPSISKDE